MPTYELAFLVAHARDLTPPLVISGQQLAPIAVKSQDATEDFKRELGHAAGASLSEGGDALAVVARVEAPDEDQAIAAAYRQAKRMIEPYSLLEPGQEAINMARFRPDVLPNALTINKLVDPPEGEFRYYDRARLVRLNIGPDATAITHEFNDEVVRRICALYPASLVSPGQVASPLDIRVARAVHWYSQAEGLAEETLVFVCYWIGLEALVLKSSSTSQKQATLIRRLDELSKRHKDQVDWGVAIPRLWDKRADIVHEGFGAVHETALPDITAEDINAVRYLFVVTLLYALEHRARGGSLEELWHPRILDAYAPAFAFTHERMPSLYQFVNQQRRTYVP